ncbi:hypothetical protein HO173_001022 [Letharia columbiana]|uniref:Uncharacterized protein n=1 Tax=Letharia columbiana TaxID=112416 RepID=A0A8H6G632_9LECA|nr:uncharacterized protein HO173_001022 [Letharia columbiana]KAF6241227.1 hypothetical protein HO173_001022 [Letharia columbiana]
MVMQVLIGLAFPQAHTASTHRLSHISGDHHPPSSHLAPSMPSKQTLSPQNHHCPCQSTMLSLHFNTMIFLFTNTLTLPLLTTSIPAPNTNQTSKIHPPALAHLPTSILPHALEADTCPTPPTEFLPYAPPPGYTPAPGCPLASEGTQPSENDPPAGVYGGSGSGSGSSGSTASAETSQAGRLKAMGAAGRVVLAVLGWRGLKWCVGWGAP